MRRNDVVRVRTSNGLETRITENHSLFSFGEQGELIPVEPAANKFVALVSDVPASEGIEDVDLLSEMKATLPAAEYEKIYCSLSGMSQAKVREMKSELSVLANARAGSFENISSACALDVSTVACVAKRLEKDNMATVARKGRKKVLELLPSGRKRLAFLQWYARNVRYYKGKYRASADAVLGEEFDARVNGQIRIESAYCKTKLRRRLSITPALCRYFGFYVSEGYSGHDKKHSRVFLAACKPAMRNRMMESVERGLKLPCRESQKGVALDSHFGFLLTRHVFGCGAGAYEKEIPAIVFNASNECKWAFLDAYFSGDGYVSKKGSVIVLTTASRKLAAGLVFLLRQLEIKKVTVRKDRVYRVNIFEPLPFARADESRGKKAYYNTVPSALRSKTAFAKFGNDYIASESHLKARMKTAKVSPVCFDYIKSISKIEVQPKYVYDIGVERTERFAGGIGLLALHNSIGEEGLDIPRVDMVVFYESVPSEVRLIQRRGRAGRVRAGKVVMLVTKGTKDEAFLWIARRKEKQMHEHMRSLKKSLESGGSDEVFAGTAFDRKQKRMDEFF